MPTAINAVNCKKYEAGLGLIDCEPFFGEPRAVIVTPPNWSLPVTETFDLDYIVEQVQNGVFVPFLNAVQFTENTGDSTKQDYTGGNRRTVRNANPDYTFEYNNGIAWHAAAYSYNGYKGRVIFIDKAGNMQLQRNVAGTQIMGFLADDINTRTYRQAAGDTSAGTMLDVHLDNPEEFNRQMVMVSRDTLGTNINSELNGIISVKVVVNSASVLNGVVVDITAIANSSFGIEALLVGNLEMLNVTTGVVSAITTATPSTSVIGRYTLVPTTAPVAGNTVVVRTKNFGLNQATLLVDSSPAQLYKGTSAPFSPVAA